MTTQEFSLTLTERPRRNRSSESIRSLIRETTLLPHHLVVPFFVIEGKDRIEPIASMPGVHRFTLDKLLQEISSYYALGIRAIDLFAYIPKEKRDPFGIEAYRPGNLLDISIQEIKSAFPDLFVMADIALDPYTTHGHDGVINSEGDVINDLTIKLLGEMSLLAAKAGVDMIAPSDMMDGRIGYLRKFLDQHGFQNVGILSYAAKYASALYGPFREALDSSPKIGDKKGYQLDPANTREALREADLDQAEGADILLIKPALSYLDIIAKIRARTHLPIAAYHVSGEYAMVMAAHEKRWLDAKQVFHEHLLSIRRAGADFIITYAAKNLLS